MPQAFTSEQMDKIRARLFESACRHAVSPGLKKTTIESLTDDAGISKSTFYKFYDSKERLFFEVAEYWENMIISEVERILHTAGDLTSKERAAKAVNAAFERLKSMKIIRFFVEDLPLLITSVPQEVTMDHYRSMSLLIVDTLKKENVQFSVSDEIMASVIHILYLCIQSIQELGEDFFDAFRELVLSACEKMMS
ncbi:MAG: TetR/AcrR family transcriptional regulator [Clostridiales bacterium]|nr:TetR/AcrR family transcriptional regulator [Clostridiales bacterium]